jgi:methylenetetrahydrofolate dehydrogenase (NADP+)/methenyltetrahydrofolate cyclohydrolase
MSATIIDGKSIADDLLTKAKTLISNLSAVNQISLAIILVGSNPASEIYVKNKLLKAKQIGINAQLFRFAESVKQEELLQTITAINTDAKFQGCIIQLPLPNHLNSTEVLNKLVYQKDVDGFSTFNVGLLNTWQDCLEPSTPLGCLYLLKKYLGANLSGKKAVVLGRSIIVGRPMASILIRESCTVTLIHSKSQDIKNETQGADILITAVGQPNLIDASYIKDGACVIDVGITKIGDKIVGDTNFASLSWFYHASTWRRRPDDCRIYVA